MSDIRVYAKKSLGQNFLVNTGVLDRIIQESHINSTDTIVEVGPGTGALTERLVASGAKVIAVEKDSRLIEPLQTKFAKQKNISIVEGDILEFDPKALGLAAGKWKLIANIPYYLTSHLIRLMLESWPSPKFAVLMVQHEVAQRMKAVPPDMNLLALSVQLYATPEVVMRVSPGSFRPMPDVDSAVIKITPTATRDQRADIEYTLKLAKQAFGQKRKQLSATIPKEALLSAGIDPTARPQELSLDQWRALAVAFH